MKRSRGQRGKTRHKLSGGRFSIAEALQTFKSGEKVQININPAIHKGMPHPRFHGKHGIISGARGQAYVVNVKDGGKEKALLARPEHLVSAF